MAWAEVALPLPLRRTLTYEIPQELQLETGVGASVVVPLGKRTLTGYVVEIEPAGEKEAPAGLRPLIDVLDPGPLFTPEQIALCRWMADYYLCAWGEVLRAAVPEGAQVRSRLRARVCHPVAFVPEDLPTAQGRLLTSLLAEGEQEAVALGRAAGVPAPHYALRRLAERGLVELHYQVNRRGFSGEQEPIPGLVDLESGTRPSGHVLTPRQQEALDPLIEALQAGTFCTALLYGVTSSGKTAVYEALVAEALRLGKGAIVLVPEIAITPQLAALFHERFGPQVALFHSRLGARRRHAEWRRVLAGQARVVIGPRSAVLAPVNNLGVMVVDEEHESSYKQSEPAPRYHARDVAVWRMRQQGGVCVLGSATPSAESWLNATSGRYLLLRLPERIDARPLPQIRVVDLTREPAPWRRERTNRRQGEDPQPEAIPAENTAGGPGAGIVLSRALEEALRQRQEREEQSILFLNRRGFSPALLCPECGHIEECRRCSVAMTFHATRGRLCCHYCGAERRPPSRCPVCDRGEMRHQGLGTQRVEAVVQALLPRARVIRMDSDATRRRGSHLKLYRDFAEGRGDVLLGTQMVAKGFHFPRVTLVGVISADAELHAPDFRANERTFQMLTQVAGRAGRGERPGEVVLQTYVPTNRGIISAARGDFEGFMADELESRRTLGYPPFGRLIRVVVRGRREPEVHRIADQIARGLQQVAPPSVDVLGPAPAPLYRLNQRFRVQVVLRGRSVATLRRCVEAARVSEAATTAVAATVDVDPVDVR